MPINVLDQWSRGLDQGMRLQQLRSQRAMQQLQERQLAQAMAIQMHQFDQQVQEQADMTRAMARVQLESQPMVPVPADGPPTAEGQQPSAFLPNPAHVPLDQSLMQNVLPVVAKYRPREVDNFVSNVAMLPYRQAQADRLLQRGGSTEPETRSLTDPATGQPITMVRTGPNSWSKVAESPLKRQLTMLEVKALQEKDPGLLKFDERVGGLVPDWSRQDEIMKALKVGTGITTGTRSALEASETSAESLVETGRKLLPLINERTAGVRGELTRLAQRTGLTMVVPGLENPEVAEAEAYGRAFTAKVIRNLRSDGNINKDEVTRLENASNTINWTTPAEGKARLAVFLDQAATLARRSYEKLGKSPTTEFLTYDQIRDRVVSGEMTPKEGAELYTNTVDSLVQTIRKEIGR